MLAFTKLVGMLLMPLGLIWLGLWGSAYWAFRRRVRGLGFALMGLAVGLALVGNVQLGHRLMGRLEAEVQPFSSKDAPLEALFVLGGGSAVDEQGRPALGDSGDRIVEAARLWHAGRVRWLVASGASQGTGPGSRNLGEETRTLWKDLGIPESAIRVIEEPCVITRDEVQAYTRLKAREGWQRVGLLSSAWHLPRAMALARRTGLEAVPVASDRRGRVPRWELWHLVPQQEGLHNTQGFCWEWLGRSMGR
ncbi:YdcF family protein [Geothrix sp. PMB-07]|uniref:YdcF family protein n=1 Tax=Geothrix sp. PMB-07 TaxID=3068640 RepID=UPI002741A1C0|nr:YdcF family protein [Geothrix sp. PMB-07]WLT31151.1 YdcF family protein [Geothrix sp. PMB-07]